MYATAHQEKGELNLNGSITFSNHVSFDSSKKKPAKGENQAVGGWKRHKIDWPCVELLKRRG